MAHGQVDAKTGVELILGDEVNLLRNYPVSKRDLQARAVGKAESAAQQIARRFGRQYFDGPREFGYGGYHYDPRFWQPVVPDFIAHFGLKPGSSVLDVGCGKGFMLYDLLQAIPALTIAGIDISKYALENSLEDVRPFLKLGNAVNLPFDDNSFDVVFAINTLHNLAEDDCRRALREVERVSKGQSFVVLDAYRNEEERVRLEAWNLTALTIRSVSEWRSIFSQEGFTGDYYWFIP